MSSGTAAVLGLRDTWMDTAPTTAYLMLGGRCQRACAFCSQARDSASDDAVLSRILWPAFEAGDIIDSVTAAYHRDGVRRACFQVTVSRDHLTRAREAVTRLARDSGIPICVSILPGGLTDVGALLEAGAERVTIALDAACARVYAQVKGGSWDSTLALLTSAAEAYPGRIGTHLIVGLGESEREMAERIGQLTDLGIGIGLFAFTPVRGTALGDCAPPPLVVYRRMQVARWLIVNALAEYDNFDYASDGQLIDYGLPTAQLRGLLSSGEALRTSGCAHCNRPYYNERPGKVLHNYPFQPSEERVVQEIEALIRGLDRGRHSTATCEASSA